MAFPFKKSGNSGTVYRQKYPLWKKTRALFSRVLNKRAAPSPPTKLLFEPLEPRILLSADLSFLDNSNTENDLTLILDEATDQYQLLDALDNIVSLDDAANAATDGIRITGTIGDDTLRIDQDTISDVIITFLTTGTDTLQGDDTDNDWEITGVDSGFLNGNITFDGFEILAGGTADDNFVRLDGQVFTGSLGGGSGNDALLGEDVVNTWLVTGTNAGTLNGTSFTGIENLIGGMLDDTFAFAAGASVAGVIEGGPDDAQAASIAVDMLDYSTYGSAVSVDLASASATGVGEFTNIDSVIGSGVTDTLLGPDITHVTWSITGTNAGSVSGEGLQADFSSFENLTGVSDSASDAFVFETAGMIAGTIDGGTSTTDGFSVFESVGMYTVFIPASPDEAGTVTVNGKNITYAGMDPFDPLATGDPDNVVITGSIFDDEIIIEDASTDGQTMVSFVGLNFIAALGGTVDSFVFDNPADSLTIEAGAGTDKIEVKSVDALFKADLLIYGNQLKTSGAPVAIDDPFVDEVIFSGSINTQSYLEVFADNITVNNDVSINAGDNDIVFRPRLIGIADAENLLPIFATVRAVSIDIGERSTLRGGGIFLIAQAEDQSIADVLGAGTEVDNFVIGPLTDLVAGLTALPIKVLVKESSATITLREDAQLIGSGTVGVYATAAADASGIAQGSLFSIGYAQAKARATVDLEAGVVIDAGDAAIVTAGGAATANLSASTSREIDSTPNPGSAQVALSLAVSYADVFSHVTVAEGASITAGKTANVIATGEISSEASAEAGIFSDGAAGLAFAIEISLADIDTTVNGSVTAQMQPGSVVKIEIDPLITDQTKPGFVDYDENMVNVGPHALVTEDTIDYTNRFGTSIGGLVDGRNYFVIALADDPTTANRDESEWIKFAETEKQAIEAGFGFETGNVVNLVDQSGTLIETANNERAFIGSDIDAENNKITLRDDANSPSNFNKFELGQAVVYTQGTAPIDGLDDGGTYYIIAPTSENNLQGDTRFASAEVVGLAESENESRAGVAIDIGAASGTGFKLAAKHVLDSGFVTGAGIVATLEAEDNATASAGLSSEDPNPSKWDKFKEKIDTNIPDTIFQSLTKSYRDNAKSAGSGASNDLAVAGAFAFSFADHIVLSNVGENAVIRSNEDLEVVATIEQQYQINAESDFEPQENTSGGSAGSSADTAVSVAIDVGIYNNTAKATVNGAADGTSGATLDGLRATRVVGDVTYPFLARLDTYIPLSAGELVDGIRTEGAEAITKYLDTTLGLKDGFFNSWAASTAKADKLGIAGSVNVLVITNDAEAIVESGVDINQDTAWRDDAINPHANQAANQDDLGGEQVVTVRAVNFMQTINMTGIFSLPEITIDPSDSKRNKLNLNPAGTAGERGGMGGAFYVSVLNNTTHAIVQDDVAIYSGADGGFDLIATEAMFTLNLTQAGASGGKLAIGGSVAVAVQTSDTLAQIGSDAIVTGRDLRLTAADNVTQVNWVGGIAVGENTGVGIAVAINIIDRDTRALIGPADQFQGTGTIDAGTAIDVSGDVKVQALVDGELWAFTVAGAAVTGKSPDMPAADESSPDGGAANSATSTELPDSFDDSVAPEASSQQSGIGIAAAVSVNVLKDETQASIVDAKTVKAGGDLAITAESKVGDVAATGGAAFAKSSSGQSASALAGALSVNNLTVNTRAFALDTRFEANDVTVSANRTGNLITVSAGAAGSASGQGTTLAGSISVNRLVNTTEAYVDDLVIVATGGGTLSATDDAEIIAIGGGVAVGGATGVGFSIGFNQIDGDTRASITDSTVGFGGALSLTAKNDNALRAVGVSVGAGKDNGVAFTLGINLIMNDVTAEILDSSVTGASAVTLLAQDDSVLQALGGAVGIGVNGSGFGGSLGWNSVTNTITAAIERSTLSGITGAVSITAKSSEEDALLDGKILSAAIGAAGSSNTSVGGALAINGIINTVDAHVSDGSSITASGDVTVTAEDSSSIKSLTGGAAISTGGSGVGIGISANFIANKVTATIDASTVDTSAGTGSITVIANESGSIDSLAVGLAGASNVAVAGSATINVIVNKVEASIAGAALVKAAGNVRVKARNAAHVGTVAGQIAISASSAAVGASLTNATVVNETDAYIDGRATVSAAVKTGTPFIVDANGRILRGVSIEADAPKDVLIFAIGGSVGSSAGIAGSFSVTVIDDSTEAYVKSPGTDTAGSITSSADVNILASSDFDLIGAAGALAIGGSAGIGVGADVGVATIRTKAYIGDGASVTADDSVVVQALATEEILSLSIAGAGSGNVAIGVTAGVSVLSLTTDAHIGANATAIANANVVVQAQDTTEIDVISGNVAIGGNVAVGVAAGVSTINKNTTSYIGSGAQVTGRAAVGEAVFTANTGTFSDGSAFNDAQQSSVSKTFQTSAVDEDNNQITIALHGFSEGQEVIYSAGSQAVRGLSSGSRYLVHVIDGSTIQLMPAQGGDAIDLRATTADNGGPADAANHNLDTVTGIGVPGVDNDNFDDSVIQDRSGTVVDTADRRGVIVTAVSTNEIATAGAAAGGAGLVAVQVAGAVNVHIINTEAHIDAGADINADNTGAGPGQGVYVDAGRSIEEVAVAAGASLSGVVSVVPAASVPVILGDTKAWIGNDSGFDTDSHSGDSFATVVNATGDVEVRATSQETVIAVAAGIAGSGIAGVAGSASVLVIDTDTLAAISGDVLVDAGGNVLVQADDDTDTWVIAGAVGIGIGGGGGAGAAAVTVLVKDTEAVIGGGAVVDADGKSVGTLIVADGDADANGNATVASMHGVAVQARSSEDVFGLGASAAGGLFVGVAGAVTVEVIDSDTLAHITGGAEVNQNNAADAALVQAVNVSATNVLDLLAIDGSLGIGAAGVGASVDVGVIRNDTTAVIGGVGTAVFARGELDVNAIAKRDISSNVISVAAGGFGLAGSIAVYSVGGNFGSDYGASSSDGSDSDSQDALADGNGDTVTGSVTDTTSGLVGGFTADDSGGLPAFDPATVSGDTITLTGHGLETGDSVVYRTGGGTAIGGLEDEKTYFIIRTGINTFQLAEDYQGALSGANINLSGGATGTEHRVLNGATSIANSARGDVADASPASRVEDAQNATTGISSGTTAAIDTGAAVVASTVDLNARNHTELDMLTGGVGLGGAAGIGIGVVVANVDSDVSAFIAPGTTVEGIDADANGVGDGALSVDAQLDSSIRSLGFAGAAGGFIGLGSAVSAINDTSDVRALLGARVNSSGTIEEAVTVGAGADIGKLAGFSSIGVTADADRILRIATGAAAVGGTGALGLAITVSNISGNIDAIIGAYAEVGSEAHDVGSVGVVADSAVTVKPFIDGDPMGIALAGGFIAGSAGITDVNIDNTAGPNVRAAIGDDASVHSSGDVEIKANITREALVTVDGGSVGAIAIGAVIGRVDIRGGSQASVGSRATVNARNLRVKSEQGDAASVSVITAGGGLGSGQGSDARTVVKPSILAFIGDSAIINTTQDTEVVATSTKSEADAKGQAFAVSGASVGVIIAKVTSSPAADAYIGSGAEVRAGESVTVMADVQSQAGGTTPSDEFSSGNVDRAEDTIDFGFPVSTGDVVTYDRNGNSAIDGLVDGREYLVLKTDTDTLQLGNAFDATGAIDADSDTINFDGIHLFETDDRVRLDLDGGLSIVQPGQLPTVSGDIFFVRVIDDQTIKLARTLTEAQSGLTSFAANTAVDDGSDFITLSGSFVDGQAVSYRAPEGTAFATGQVEIRLMTVGGERTPVDDDGDGVPNDFLGDNTIVIPNHGFTKGEALIYTGPGLGASIPGGALVNGATYYVIEVDSERFKLAATLLDATGRDDDPNTANTDESHPVTPIVLTPDKSTELKRGTEHELTRRTDQALSGLVDGKTYYIVGEGVNGPGTVQLAEFMGGTAIPISNIFTDSVGSTALTGMHRLGTEGLDLRAGTGTQKVVIDIDPDPVSSISGIHRFLGPGGIDLSEVTPPSGDGLSSASTLGGGAGILLDVSIPTASAISTPTAKAHVGAALVEAGGDLNIESRSFGNVNSNAVNKSGGIIKIGKVDADSTVNATAKSYIGTETSSVIDATGVVITADGNIGISAETDSKAKGHSEAKGGGVIAVAVADTDVSFTTRTRAEIGRFATVTGNTVDMVARVDRIDGRAESDSFAGGLFGASTANNTIKIDSDVDAVVGGDNTKTNRTRVTGFDGIDIRALTEDVTASFDADAVFIGIGPSIEKNNKDFDLDTFVEAEPSGLITLGPRNPNVTPPLEPFETTPLTRVALFVEANEANISGVDADKRSSGITWDSDVVVFGAQSPELVVDELGNVDVAVGVTLNNDAVSQGGSVSGNFSVDDISNTGGGQVVFDSDAGTITSSSTEGVRGLFDFRNNFESVDLTNLSNFTMTVNNVNVLNNAASPRVELDATTVSMLFDITRSTSPTLVDILGDGSGDIIFNGTIENPIGLTRIINTGGNVFASNARGVTGSDGRNSLIRTNILDINAAGSIGSVTTRINVDLVHGPSTPIQDFSAIAGEDIYLDLKARLRDSSVVVDDDNPWTVTLDLLSAGRTADVIFQPGVQETGVGLAGGVLVKLPDGNSGLTGTYFNRFQPDKKDSNGDIIKASQDPGAFATLDDDNTIATTYDLTLATAGTSATGNIVLKAALPTASDPRVNLMANTNIVGTGHIDADTNGFINFTETVGDMRVGEIKSRANDVTLTAPGSIVDAPIGAGDPPTSGDAAADVTGINLNLVAGSGIGSTDNFLEINSSSPSAGALTALADQSVFIIETAGDLNVNTVESTSANVTLNTFSGSILDANADDAFNVSGADVNLDANSGSIGTSSNDLDIDSSVPSSGRLAAEATNDIYLTEVDGTLNVLLAEALDGAGSQSANVRLTVRESADVDEDLVLLSVGTPQFSETDTRTLTRGRIAAGDAVELRVGDDITAPTASDILGGLDDPSKGVIIRGDYGDLDTGFGTNILLAGTITPGADSLTQIFGNVDVDIFTFEQTTLGGETRAYGSASADVPANALVDDGEDRFNVNQLQTMNVAALHTLTLDGQADTDSYTVYTTGSRGDQRDYVINALDSGAKDDGVDTLEVFGFDSTLNGEDDPSDDIFLLRRTSFITGKSNPVETSENPAFVALLHGTLDQARLAGDAGDEATERPQEVQRVNYDVNINGRLNVYGQGGNDWFAVDDNSVITTLDGGAGHDSFQIGQIFGSLRELPNVSDADTFETIATTRGYVSPGISAPLLAQGGDGNDQFTVYSNKAELRLEGDAGNDLFIVRAFALAETNPDGTIMTDGNGVAIPKLTEFSTQELTEIKPGDGDDTVQYNTNAPVSIDGGSGFDKVVALGTEFPDNFVITKDGIFGGGLQISYKNVEVVEIDGLEGDDDFYVLSTPFGVATRLIGGLGSDQFSVTGDVSDTITSRDLEGRSGVINHALSSDNPLYDGLTATGIDLNVTSGSKGVVILEESDGDTTVREGTVGSEDSYTVSLAVQPTAGTIVYVTVSAARSPRNEEVLGGDSMLIRHDGDASVDSTTYARTVVVDGVDVEVPNRAVVLAFDESDWNTPKTVLVKAVDDGLAEGERAYTISTSVSVNTGAVQADKDIFDQAAVQNIEVAVIDDDAVGVTVTETDGGTRVLEGSLILESGFTKGIADSYDVQLARTPTGTVTVQLDFDATQLTLANPNTDTRLDISAGTITFDGNNWSDAVTVGVQAINDSVREDPKTVAITHTIDDSVIGHDTAFDGLSSQLGVEVLDDDTAGVLVTESDGSTLVSKDGTTLTDTYTVRLTSDPVNDVTVDVVTDGQTTTVPTALTFTTANWWIPQTVTVSGEPTFVPEPGTDDIKTFSARPHLVSELRGPLAIEGGSIGPRALLPAILLPGEDNDALLEIGEQPPEIDQIDTVNIYDDSSQEDKTGLLESARLSGLNMADDLLFPDGTAFGEPALFPGGISFGQIKVDPDTGEFLTDGASSSIEVLNLMLGTGNDNLTIEGTLLQADEGENGPARHGSLTLIHGGGNSLLDDGTTVGGDTITVTGGGGPGSPLVIYGDTSQDGLWYSGDPSTADRTDNLTAGLKLFDQVGTADDLFRFGRANPFDFAGNDIIDASALDAADVVQLNGTATVGITAYGGGGNDTIIGSQLGDVLAGGSGNDNIHGNAGDDLVYGDSGFNVDPITRTLIVPTADAGYSSAPAPTRDLLAAGQDTIDGGTGFDIAFGDHGIVTQDVNPGDVFSINLAQSRDTDNDSIPDAFFGTFNANTGASTLTRFDANEKLLTTARVHRAETDQYANGDIDTILGGTGDDMIFGGGGGVAEGEVGTGDGQGDIIYAGSGDDLVFADQGEIFSTTWTATPVSNDVFFQPESSLPLIDLSLGGYLDFNATNVDTLTGAGNDLVYGQAGRDFILGQQGADTLHGGADDDAIIGGSNVAGALDSGDRIDGSGGNDLIAGDNADVTFRPDTNNVDPRMRVLPGTAIYGITPGADDGESLATTAAQDDPRGFTQYITVLLDHDGSIESGNLELYGDDYIAGGADDDEIFGQLGADTIQGDGRIGTDARTDLTIIADEGAPTAFGASRGAPTAGPGGDLAIGVGELTVTASFEVATDGDDYIEGNGGSDVVFGNLGQDDIIGGSSDLFGLTLATQRPDGSDLLFGGAGTDISRNNIGDATADANDNITTDAGGHARDADTIAGDNARILRLVGINGTARGTGVIGPNDAGANGVASSGGFLNFNYDVNGYPADIDPATYDRIIARAVDFLDYTPGGTDFNSNAENDRGAVDEIHGESGDDFVYGMTGNDILFGEGQNDDLIGGYGNDWISGGTGSDGVLGDDGRIMVSRNASTYGEPLHGVAALLNGNALNEVIDTPGANGQTAIIHIAGALKKTVNITPFSFDPAFNGATDEFPNGTNPHNADDIIFGGLGTDWLHGASGDDAISGGEALAESYTQVFDGSGNLLGVARSDYTRPYNPGDVLRFNPIDVDGTQGNPNDRAGEFRLYDEFDPRRKIMLTAAGELDKSGGGLEFFLNFDPTEGVLRPGGVVDGKGNNDVPFTSARDDGADIIFGDLGNDWLVGGTGTDNSYGGFGNDLMNADDDHSTNGGLNDAPDTNPFYYDRAFGGAGRDVMIANTGGDRLIDWAGEFNSYIVPFAPFGQPTVSRTLQPQLPEFLYALSAGDGADPTRFADTGAAASEAFRNGEPQGELGLVVQQDDAFQDQTGGPADPQPGNIPGGQRDVFGNETIIFNQALRAAFVNAPLGAVPSQLNAVELESVLEAAIDRWVDSGLADTTKLDALRDVSFQIVNLSDGLLGRASEGVIYIDADAAGLGWFVDETPADDSEYLLSDVANLLLADAAGDANGSIDLLTVVSHELGHVLGYDHDDSGLMDDSLQPGVRKTIDSSGVVVVDTLGSSVSAEPSSKEVENIAPSLNNKGVSQADALASTRFFNDLLGTFENRSTIIRDQDHANEFLIFSDKADDDENDRYEIVDDNGFGFDGDETDLTVEEGEDDQDAVSKTALIDWSDYDE